MNESVSRINAHYDDAMYSAFRDEHYGHSDFFNYGYWDSTTRDQKVACENLLEKLLAFFPSKSGDVLDVACGKGGSSRYLLKYYPPEAITGINISEKQLATCRENVPGARFLLMDASTLDFEDNTFDNILCVESAFHFDTRESFIAEAYRVLKPNGCLALSDILLTKWGEENNPYRPNPHIYADLAEYETAYRDAGFETVDVVDATLECWYRFCRNTAHHACQALVSKRIDKATFDAVTMNVMSKLSIVEHYLVVGAVKG